MEWLKPFYKMMGDVETRLLKSELSDIEVKQPIYVSSLPRSGTTILSEILSQHPDTCHHSYADFPGVFTPYWKNWIRQRQWVSSGEKAVRAHQDRILINNDSIEAFEEVIWMYFYPQIHQAGLAHQVKYDSQHQFNRYYSEHIKKHLLVKNKTRYLTKANYNSNRIQYLLQLFPDARFLIPVRHPLNHIASLMKQHQMFLKAGQQNKQINHQLAASGHFEFGALREVLVMDDSALPQKITEQFQQGDEVMAWAQYWLYFYQSLLQLKHQSAAVNQAVMFVKFEDLCFQSGECLDQVFEHCELDLIGVDELKRRYQSKLSPPDYYSLPFTEQQKNDIMSTTNAVANLFGYVNHNHT